MAYSVRRCINKFWKTYVFVYNAFELGLFTGGGFQGGVEWPRPHRGGDLVSPARLALSLLLCYKLPFYSPTTLCQIPIDCNVIYHCVVFYHEWLSVCVCVIQVYLWLSSYYVKKKMFIKPTEQYFIKKKIVCVIRQLWNALLIKVKRIGSIAKVTSLFPLFSDNIGVGINSMLIPVRCISDIIIVYSPVKVIYYIL